MVDWWLIVVNRLTTQWFIIDQLNEEAEAGGLQNACFTAPQLDCSLFVLLFTSNQQLRQGSTSSPWLCTMWWHHHWWFLNPVMDTLPISRIGGCKSNNCSVPKYSTPTKIILSCIVAGFYENGVISDFMDVSFLMPGAPISQSAARSSLFAFILLPQSRFAFDLQGGPPAVINWVNLN